MTIKFEAAEHIPRMTARVLLDKLIAYFDCARCSASMQERTTYVNKMKQALDDWLQQNA